MAADWGEELAAGRNAVVVTVGTEGSPPSKAGGHKGEPIDAGAECCRDGSAGRVGKRRLGLPRRGPAGKS